MRQRTRRDVMSDLSGKAAPGELELINKYTRTPLNENDVYVFSVVLCDNDIDRDCERFSDSSLEKLSELYVGVTGITDHEAKSSNQSARVFSCKTETLNDRQCSDGRTYKRLFARAYIPRNDRSRPLIEELESGIKKEVSVGCSVKRRICSICGNDIAVCDHIRGRKYAGKLCYVTLDEPTDAYEWSLVAVPAQKMAGVVKSYDRININKHNNEKGVSKTDIEKKLFAGEEQSFSAEEMKELISKFKSLEKKAFDGEFYRDKLIKEVKSLSAIVLPELGEDTLGRITEELSVRQLDELIKAFQVRAEDILPVRPQLFRGGSKASVGNEDYQNI